MPDWGWPQPTIVQQSEEWGRELVGRGVKNRGPTHALDGWPLTATLGLGEAWIAQPNVARDGGVCHDGKPPAFCAMQDRKSTESFSRSLQGRIHGGPDRKLASPRSYSHG